MISDYLTIIRTLFYLLIGVCLTITSYIYYFGYIKIKHTPIIYALTMMMFSLGVYFAFITFLAVSAFLNREARDFFLLFTIIFQIPVLYYVNMFRIETSMLQRDEKKEIIQKLYKQNVKLVKEKRKVK